MSADKQYTPAEAVEELPEYSQGVCCDGAAILKDGVMMTVDQIVAELNALAARPASVGGNDPVGRVIGVAEVSSAALLHSPLPVGTKLYTQPQQLAVTDEMVEQAIIAGCATRPGEYQPNWPDAYSADEVAHGRTFMRAALTDALPRLTRKETT